MKRYRVVYAPAALDDLLDIEIWIGAAAGTGVATGYMDRVKAACRALQHFPERRTPRTQTYPGLRSIVIERRVEVSYLIEEDQVAILRVLYAGRQFGSP